MKKLDLFFQEKLHETKISSDSSSDFLINGK